MLMCAGLAAVVDCPGDDGAQLRAHPDMNLIALGINHNSAAVEVRERGAFAPEQVGRPWSMPVSRARWRRRSFSNLQSHRAVRHRAGGLARRTRPCN